MRRLTLLAVLLLMVAVSAGCKMNIALTTTIISAEEMDQEMVVVMEGLGGGLLEGDVDPSGLAQAEDGWTSEVTTEGEDLVMRSSKRLKIGEPLFPPGEVDESAPDPTFDLQVVESPSEREYRLTVLLPAGEGPAAMPTSPPTPLASGEDLEFDSDMARLGEEMARAMMDMFRVTWTINVPGQVVETNADVRTPTGGTWVIRMDEMQVARELTLVSRETK